VRFDIVVVNPVPIEREHEADVVKVLVTEKFEAVVTPLAVMFNM
jgi:hypothetical protein